MNKADYVLCLTAVFFVCCLAVKIIHHDLWIARAAFFVAEAMLVGGIADWFAVTALFKKPLGFSYHTALLPRGREKFIRACVRMIQDDFFSKKRLLTRIKKMNLSAQITEYLADPQGKTFVVGFFVKVVEELLEKLDRKKLAEHMEKMIFSGGGIYSLCYSAIKRNLGDEAEEELFDQVLCKVRGRLAEPQRKEEIEQFLRVCVAEKSPGVLGGLLSLLAEAANVVNFEEAAEIIHHQLMQRCEDMFARDDEVRRLLIAKVKIEIERLADDGRWQALEGELIDDLHRHLFLQKEIEKGLHTAELMLRRPECAREERMIVPVSPLVEIIFHQVDAFSKAVAHDEKLREKIDIFIGEVFCRGALEARAMIGVIVEEALKGLNDEELSKLVYDKVEQDMIWLRMNGSIVGGIIGALLFCAIELLN